MRIAMAAVGFRNGDISFNVNKMIEIAREYSGRVEMIVFGETFLQGFDSLNWDFEHDSKIAISIHHSIIDVLRKEAERCRVALSFGYVEKDGNILYSSQITIGDRGEILNNYRRVSKGWKEEYADLHYCEGSNFDVFEYKGIIFTVGLCGDLWHEENRHRIKALGAKVLLWPVYTDYNHEEWNKQVKHEYVEQAAGFCGSTLYVNSVCLDKTGNEMAQGGAAYFRNGIIAKEVPAGAENVLVVTI